MDSTLAKYSHFFPLSPNLKFNPKNSDFAKIENFNQKMHDR